jgi:ubiquinone/menaquinone biosynthesis C-methylase UbiE
VSGEIEDHFAARSSTYDKKGVWVRDPLVMSVTIDFLDVSPKIRLIDIGSGTGAVLENVLLRFPHISSCVALDISKKMLSHISNPRIEKCLHDAHHIPYPHTSFDVVLCRQVLHYITDINKCLQEVQRILDDRGAIVIGQITPFGEKDEEWWKRILRTRQPLRKYFLTLNDLVLALIKNRFTIVRMAQIRAKESLNSWLSRYSDSVEQVEQVRALHTQAPKVYKELHRFQEIDNDIVFDNCWTFIRSVKSKAIK